MTLAKSDGTTLLKHTQDLLVVFDALKQAIPILPVLAQKDNFWSLLYQAIVFHDLGKMSTGFQNLMKKTIEKYSFRHEWLSAAFVPTLELTRQDENLVMLAILAHHKLFKRLYEEYEQSQINYDAYQQGDNPNIEKNPFFKHELKTINIDEVCNFLESFNIQLNDIIRENPLPERIKPWLENPVPSKIDQNEKKASLLLSAALSICDHNASAGMLEVPVLGKKNFNFLEEHSPYGHQTKLCNASGNVLLIAPTGSGKTEAALGWLDSQLQIRQGRAFYILPFTASINAMVQRSVDNFENSDLVGLLHGKARYFIDEHYDLAEGQTLKDLMETHKKFYRPFKVMTPFQILKWAFGVKGFEKGLTELAGAYLIFDEIHVYDRELFERVLFFIQWLIENLAVKVCVMTATMPSFMLQMICDVLKVEKPIRADDVLLEKTKRHKIKLLDGEISEYLGMIQDEVDSNKSVLVVCNTVQKAQEIFKNIKTQDKVLLHSSFNARDRAEKESRILAEQKPKLLVGTQAIEVSLNIDYDLIVSEAAPLDALLQRFGRVYRQRTIQKSAKANCFVCKYVDEEAWKKIYNLETISNTLIALDKINEQIICENEVQDMLDYIYTPFEIDEILENNFLSMLDNLFPFRAYEENEEKFNEQFDGIEVLPAQLYGEWQNAIEKQAFLDAEKLFVPISKNKYSWYLKNHLINYGRKSNLNRIFPIVSVKYCSKIGLTDEIDNGLDW